METPKTKMQMVREYVAEHPTAKAKEIAAAVGCHFKLVELALDPERYERYKASIAAAQRKRYHTANPEARHLVSRHQQWLVIAKAERKRCNSKPYVRVVPPRKPADRPVSNEATALQRECDRLIDEMATCTTAEYPALARRYSELQIRLDYAQTMANGADRELATSRALMEKRPLCQRVANGGGFQHH